MTDDIATSYEPKYITLEDVPLSGPDEYTSEEKRKAIFSAESSLELDVNGGEEIPADERVSAHRTAVMNLATHILTHAAEEPSDVTIGDMATGGGGVEYSSRYLDEYNRLTDELTSITGGSTNTFSVAVNTASDERAEGAEERLN